MKTRGFTLVELLAVIVVLSVLVLITSGSITGIYKGGKEDLYSTQIALIEASAKQWGSENKHLLPVASSENSEIQVYLLFSDIQESGILDEVINPKTGEEFTDEDIIIKITAMYNDTYDKSSIKYEVVTDNIESITSNFEYILDND